MSDQQLPTYEHRRVVGAFKIGDIQREKVQHADSSGQQYELHGLFVTYNEETEQKDAQIVYRVPVSSAWVAMQKPQIGGYYVKHQDGTEIYLAAEKFEAAYQPTPED